jgi:hypothetical protein
LRGQTDPAFVSGGTRAALATWVFIHFCAPPKTQSP